MQAIIKLDPAVADVLARSTIDEHVLCLPKGQLPRPLYEQVDKALQALGGKWNRQLRGHLFDRDPNAALAEALARGSVEDRKKTLQQFWTPPEIVGRMCDLAGDIEGTDVLEPSAGKGHILFEIIGRGGLPTAVEIDPAEAMQLEAEVEGRWPIVCADFLNWTPCRPYTPTLFDFIIMNPPFARNQDIAHVRRAYDLLKPGGRLVAITSPHWTFASDRAAVDFRQWFDEHGDSNDHLPTGTFKAMGTGVGSQLISLTKAEASDAGE